MIWSRISKASSMSTTMKGAGWKTPMALRVPMMSMASRVSMIPEGMPGEMAKRGRTNDLFLARLMPCNEEWSCWSCVDMRMTAMKAVLRN